MNVEELTKVAEIIGGLGDTASNSFLLYLGFDIVSSLITFAGFMILIGLVYKLIKPLALGALVDIKFREFRNILGIGNPGEVTNSELYNMGLEIKRLQIFEQDNKANN